MNDKKQFRSLCVQQESGLWKNEIQSLEEQPAGKEMRKNYA